MMNQRWIRLSVVFLLLLLAFPIRTARSAPAPDIDPALIDRFATEGRADFIVRFAEQADLSPAFAMDWHDRGWFVYETLKATAARSQAEAIDLVKGRRLDYRSFIAGNELYVYAGDLATADALAALPGVAAVAAPRTYYVDPLLVGAASAQPEALTWGVIDVQADQFWSTFGLQGEGSVVSNIDTGVDYQHDALDQAYKCQSDPGDPACWYDPTETCPDAPCDDNNHGTATMGPMVADDDPTLPHQAGVAPGAQWIACKAIDQYGGSTEEDLNACADWILAPDDNPDNRPSVVLNAWSWPNGCDPWFQDKVQAWVAAGIFPAFSPGGGGPGCATLLSPADYQEAFAGTAHDSNRNIASFAPRGPSCYGHDPYTKPNISAPGVNMCVPVADPPDGWNCGYSGTSFSAAFPPGVAALLWSCAPQLRGQVYATFEALQNTADTPPAGDCGAPEDGEGNYTYGYGYLNALAAGLSYCVQEPGTLAGHVYEAGTGNPIVGATVTAVPGPVQDITDAQGYYSMTLDWGTYTVTAAATGYVSATTTVEIQAGLTTTQDFSLTLPTPPTPAFISDSPVCLGAPMHFTDTSTANPPVTAWLWDFGDGAGTSTEQHPTYTYTATGDYTVTLWVTNTEGSAWVTGTVTVNPLPEASLEYGPDVGLIPLTVYFTDTSKHATNPTWDLGDGFGDVGDHVSHTYDMAGTYLVTLTVDSAYGCGIDEAYGTVTAILAGAPVASFDAELWEGCGAPLEVQFTDTSVAEPPVTEWLWHLGDGATSTETNPLHTYAETGDYVVTLWVTNTMGSDMVTDTISVHELPMAAFDYDPIVGCAPLTVTFTNTSQYAESPLWAFGDGSYGAGDTITHTYAATGTFPVVLTVTSPYGCGTDTVTATVAVYEPGQCIPVSIVRVNQAADGCVVGFDADLAGDAPFTYTWSFAFGTFGVPTPTVDLVETGTYTGTLDVWNCGGEGHDMAVFTVEVTCEPPFRVYLPLLLRE